MVDPIGSKPIAAAVERRVRALAPAQAAAPSIAAERSPAGLAAIASSAAATPPVDAERVAKIRKAIEDGRFPIYPATIADRLLAFKLDWNPDEQA